MGARCTPRLSKYEKLLVFLFLLTLPLSNPWIRGDGVGYYAYIRALLIEKQLRFENDWRAANSAFATLRLDSSGNVKADQYTSTGHLDNHFSVGPAILWAPFLTATHLAVRGANGLGAHLPADGFSRPYRLTMAITTAFYGFLGIYLAFQLCRNYFEEHWAFLATVGIWFASSLPAYMYFNPSWSHAHSAFAVSLFLWYWHRTRGRRGLGQWALLGFLSGLMINVYYPNCVLLLVPLSESFSNYWAVWRVPGHDWVAFRRLFTAHLLHVFVTVVTLLPTFVTRQIIYGSPLAFGYDENWFWSSPALEHVLFSWNHGLLSWTPILGLAVLGLFLFAKKDRPFSSYPLLAFLGFSYFIASYPCWHGLSSYGNRFFVSLTPLFVLGLAEAWHRFRALFPQDRPAFLCASVATAVFVLWNVGLLFQWGTHVIPARGPISWRQMVHNQVTLVPVAIARTAKSYFVAREALMSRIEQEDIQQIERQESEGR